MKNGLGGYPLHGFLLKKKGGNAKTDEMKTNIYIERDFYCTYPICQVDTSHTYMQVYYIVA